MSILGRSQQIPEAEKIKIQAILHQNYRRTEILKPMEVKLENDEQGALHLVEVKRKTPDAYETERINSIFELNDKDQPCTLSRFKSFQQGMTSIRPKLVICICCYNQDKGMLKNSLNGIYDSLDMFKTKANILPEQIVVVVLFDGIEKVRRGQHSEDMITFFDEIDFMNGSILREGEESYESYLEKEQEVDWSRVSHYTKEEIETNRQKRFRTMHTDYMKALSLKKACEEKNRPIDLAKVPNEVLQKYRELMRKEVDGKTEYQITQLKRKLKKQGKELSGQDLKMQTARFKLQNEERFENYENHKNFMEKAYTEVRNLAAKYLSSRQQTSLVIPMDFTPTPGQIGSIPREDEITLNVLLVVKHKNAGKLSSHALFFLGFCDMMDPQLCMLMDVGLKPLDDAIYKLFQYMDLHPNCGGSCGYMGLRCQRSGDQFGSSDLEHVDAASNILHNSLFSIQKAQLFEYHFGHLIDKPFEAWFNFIHVLPGAFSCYRYECLKGESLLEYLSPVLDTKKERSLEEENRYLAEDRTLSLILKSKNYDFAYIPKAKAVVDPASDLITMFGQRRRWINGSWFAFFHVHSQRQKISSCLTQLQFMFYYFIHGLTYVSLGLYFIALYLTVESFLIENMPTMTGAINITPTAASAIIDFVYIIMLGSMFFLSLQVKNTDKKFQGIYYFISSFLGLYGVLVLVLMIYNLANIGTNGFTCKPSGSEKTLLGIKLEESCIPATIRALMVGTIVLYALQVLFCFSWRILWEILISVPSYLFYSPTYMNLLMIYAFCKIDDFSWGTKGLEKGANSKQKLEEQNRIKKYKHVGKYILWNSLVAIVIIVVLQFNPQNAISGRVVFVLGFAIFLFIITVFKFIISISYLIGYYIRDSCLKYPEETLRINISEGIALCDAVKKRIQKIKIARCQQILQSLNIHYSNSVIRLSKIARHLI